MPAMASPCQSSTALHGMRVRKKGTKGTIIILSLFRVLREGHYMRFEQLKQTIDLALDSRNVIMELYSCTCKAAPSPPPSSIVMCVSWPQACIWPCLVDPNASVSADTTSC